MQHPLVIGNWKLNGSIKILKNLIINLYHKLKVKSKYNVIIAPPMIYLSQLQKELIGNQIFLCSQNVDINLFGSYTGDISAAMLKDIGVKYVIIGHSERRFYHLEDNKIVAKKFAIVKSQGLTPILCIGESEQEKNKGQTQQICANQIDSISSNFGIKIFKNTIIAYEPIWAIGTGKHACPVQIKNINNFIYQYIAKQDLSVAKNISIYYGGSVNKTNVYQLFTESNIDGVLVGNTSLNIDDLINIINIAMEHKK